MPGIVQARFSPALQYVVLLMVAAACNRNNAAPGTVQDALVAGDAADTTPAETATPTPNEHDSNAADHGSADAGSQPDTATCGYNVWSALGVNVAPVCGPPCSGSECWTEPLPTCGACGNLPGTPCDPTSILEYYTVTDESQPPDCWDIQVMGDQYCACNPLPSGQLVCLGISCANGCSCPTGYECKSDHTFDGGERYYCLNTAARRGTPCKSYCGDAGSPMHCVAFGDQGHFCAENYGGNSCEAGYHFGLAAPIGYNNAAKPLCLPDNPTATACQSAYAKQVQLATPCTMTDGTPGTRHCGPGGLTECAP